MCMKLASLLFPTKVIADKNRKPRYKELKEEVYKHKDIESNEEYNNYTVEITYKTNEDELRKEVTLEQIQVYEIIGYVRYKELLKKFIEVTKQSREPVTELRKQQLVEHLIDITDSYKAEVTKEEIIKNIMENSEGLYYNKSASKIIGDNVEVLGMQLTENKASYDKTIDQKLYDEIHTMLELHL